MRFGIIGIILIATGLQAHATPPHDIKPAKEAQLLHRKAVNASKSKGFEQAIKLWRQAEARHPIWKYAFNLASTHAFKKKWKLAWSALERVQAYGQPVKHTRLVVQLRKVVRVALLRNHAHIELKVLPVEAQVLRNGMAWEEPRRVWTADDSSNLIIRLAGYETVKTKWSHPTGQIHEPSTIRLVKTVSQEVEENTIALGVASGDGDSMSGWQWTTIGTGIALLAGGAGSLAWSESLADELNTLNDTPGTDYNTYSTQFDQDKESAERARFAGWVLTGVGAAILTAGIVWLLLEDVEKPDPLGQQTMLEPVLLPHGGGLRGTVRF
jgi:hypothetical protein